MILIGDVELEPARRQLIEEAGGIIAAIEGDHFVRFWLGEGEGRDFLLAHIVAANGNVFFMGRIREHVDDKIVGSKDRKQVMRTAIAVEQANAANKVAKLCLFAASSSGIASIYEIEVGGDLVAFQEAHQQAMLSLPGWDGVYLSMRAPKP